MKKLFFTICFLFAIFYFLFSCDSESANDCIKKSGAVVKREIQDISAFDRIRIEEGIELILFQNTEQKIEIETGENLINDISVSVTDGELIIKNNISCNWFREYNPAKVYVTFSEISKIYSVSQHKIRSTQLLEFDEIELSSGLNQEAIATEFNLNISCNRVVVNANDATYLKLSGNAEAIYVGFWAGEPRLDARDLIVNQVDFFQRSANDIIVNPQQAIRGDIYSTGNVIIKNAPPLIEVNQHYTGSLIID